MEDGRAIRIAGFSVFKKKYKVDADIMCQGVFSFNYVQGLNPADLGRNR